MQITSDKSSFAQIGIGVPQNRFRDTAQSRASFNQLWNRPSFTSLGTQYVCLLFSTTRSLISSTLTNHDGTAL